MVVRLDRYSQGDYRPGASLLKQLLWYFVGSPLLRTTAIPFSAPRTWLLRRFGARIGRGVRIKPGVYVKFPWRLEVGDHVWLGEQAWLDNLDRITIENHVCVSQKAYLCTGNHDWSREDFALRPRPIHLEQGCWVGAGAIIGPGVTVGRGAVLTLGSVTTHTVQGEQVYAGNPSRPIRSRA